MTKEDFRFIISNVLMGLAIVTPVCLAIVAMCLIFG